MKKKEIKFCKKLQLSNDNEFLSVDSRIKNKKKDSLFSQKASLQKLLKQIKICLLDYMSNKSTKNKNKETKEILSLFKDNLNKMLQDKNKIYNNYKKEKQNKIKKKPMTDRKYLKTEQDKYDNLNHNKVMNDEKLLHTEISQLKLLNFLIENEIKSTDFLIGQNNQVNLFIKTNPIYIFENNEVYCKNNNENISIVSDLLSEDRNKKIKKFINTVNKKSEQENETKSLSKKVEDLKGRIKKNGQNKYINSDEVIFELSKEYTKNSNIPYNINLAKFNLNNNNYNNNNINYKNNFFEEKKNSVDKNIFFIKQKNVYSNAVINSI